MTLTPRLIVRGADAAISFYEAALGAQLVERFADPGLGKVVHALLKLGEDHFSLADEHEDWGLLSAHTLECSPMLLSLEVEDADAAAEAMVKHGATVVIALADRFYGKREGRLRDPFGVLWILSQPLETLSDDEIRRRMTPSG